MALIKHIKWGTACRIGNIIYLNSKLKAHPELYKALLNHELAHSSGFTRQDLKMEFTGAYFSHLKKEYYLFIFKNPKSWIMFLPVWRYESRWIIDPLILGAWLLGISFGGILWKLL